MKYKVFGKTDMRFSVVGFGAWQAGMKSWGSDYTKDDVINAMNVAFKLGVNFIDTAEIYGYGESERIVAKVLEGWRDIYIATKIAGYNAKPGKILKSIRRSLDRLRCSVIDLYQVHWPPSYYTPLCKVFKELEKAVDLGLIRYIGLSNFPRRELERSMFCMKKYEIVSNQVKYNLLFRAAEKELFPFMKSNDMAVLAWSPIAKGALAGKKKANAVAKLTDTAFLKVRRAEKLLTIILSIAKKHNISPAQVAIAWLIAKDVFPIPGAKRVSQARENALAGDIILNNDEVKILDSISKDFLKGSIRSVVPRYIPNIFQEGIIRLVGGI